jgi:outer membrane protein TolC
MTTADCSSVNGCEGQIDESKQIYTSYSNLSLWQQNVRLRENAKKIRQRIREQTEKLRLTEQD